MKKIFAILISVFFLSSCGGYIDNGSAKAMRISGILTEKTSTDSNPGTHLLVTDDLKVYPVSSILIKLSDPKYLGNKIELIGSLEPTTNLFSASGISVLEVMSKEPEKTTSVSFIEYKDTDFGFSIFYYDDWTYLVEGNKVVFTSKPYKYEAGDAVDTVEMSQFSFKYDQSVFDSQNQDSPLKNYLATNFPEISDFSKYSVKIGSDSLDAIKMENVKGGYDTYFYRNGLIYVLSFLPYDSLSVSMENSRIYSEMLNSFKFLGFTVDGGVDNLNENTDIQISNIEVPDLNVVSFTEPEIEFAYFDSNSYQFRAKYPKNWYFQGQQKNLDSVKYSYIFSKNSDPLSEEMYSVDILDSMPVGAKEIKVNGMDLKMEDNSEKAVYYVSSQNKVFKVSGLNEYKDFILSTILSIETFAQ